MTAVRWLALLPVLGILVGVAFVNQVEPLVFGLPFVLAWIVGWVVVGAALMAIVYALDPVNAKPEAGQDGRPAMNAALVIIGLTALVALALGLAARRGLRMSLEQWTVGGRAFGGPLVFLLTAGEIYTTFTFLGGSGYAYGQGAPAYYILAYGSLAYILSYWLLPPIWRYAKQERAGLAVAFLRQEIRQPLARDSRRARRRGRARSLSRAAVQGPRHHRLHRLLRLDLVDRSRSGSARRR